MKFTVEIQAQSSTGIWQTISTDPVDTSHPDWDVYDQLGPADAAAQIAGDVYRNEDSTADGSTVQVVVYEGTDTSVEPLAIYDADSDRGDGAGYADVDWDAGQIGVYDADDQKIESTAVAADFDWDAEDSSDDQYRLVTAALATIGWEPVPDGEWTDLDTGRTDTLGALRVPVRRLPAGGAA
jgi:hypothetical protein